jgi:hypothetical protein
MRIRIVISGPRAPFLHPISPDTRTAVLSRGFRSAGNVRVFPEGWSKDVEEFQPATIAGSKDQLASLMLKRIPSLTHALICVSRSGDKRITEAERERLWRAFGVPLFEQVVDGSGHLLAGECEAHDGLHVESQGFKLADHFVDSSPCGCGRKTPRLRTSRQPELERVAASAR